MITFDSAIIITKSQRRIIDQISKNEFDVRVRELGGRKISVVATKDHGSVFLNEHYHIFVGPGGKMEGVHTGNFGTVGNDEYANTCFALFSSEVFHHTKAIKVKKG